MKAIKRFGETFALSTLALALTACGGGGGDGSGTGGTTTSATGGPSEPVAPVVPVAESTIVSNVPVPTYTNGSQEQAAFALLNTERGRCGFGLLKQDTRLDNMAYGHAYYLLANFVAGHFQSDTDPFYTGNSPADRAKAASYDYRSIEDDNMDMYGTVDLTGRGEKSIRGLLSAPYHGISLINGNKDVGVSVLNSDATGTTATYGARIIGQVNLGYENNSSKQLPAGDEVLTYPCDGTTGTAFELRGESPNPVPGRDLSTNPVGQPVYVKVRDGQILTVTAATMVKKSDGTPVALRAVMTKDNDPNSEIGYGDAVILPDAALLPNTEYLVTITGTNTTATPGTADTLTSTGTNPMIKANSTGGFTKTFTWTTGS